MSDSVSEPVRGPAVRDAPRRVPAVGLSVIIDSRLDLVRARQVAAFIDRLGLAGAWLRRPEWPLNGPLMSEADSASLLTRLAREGRVRAGLIADAGKADASWPQHLTGSAVREQADAPQPAGLRIALSGEPADVRRWQRMSGRRPDTTVTQLALPAAAAVLPLEEGATPASAIFIPCSPDRDLAAAVSAAASVAGGLPVLAEVAVSVGRTAAEATARADADELFSLAGHPARQGLFGTLEECQAAASHLAHAGITELICQLPLTSDLPDVLAQLRSIAIGAGVLRPGDPPSAAPPPPTGWGGRRSIA
jgi:hypothetical protein